MREKNPKDEIPALEHTELEQVIRRALELQDRSNTEKLSRLSGEELREIGREVGIESEFLRQAVEELQPKAPARPVPPPAKESLGEGGILLIVLTVMVVFLGIRFGGRLLFASPVLLVALLIAAIAALWLAFHWD